MPLLSLAAADLLDRFASPDPTPGGGSAAALAGATAAALVVMVCAMPKTRSGDPGERGRLDAALADARAAGDRLRKLVDEDAAAYDGVVAAYRLPKANDDEKAARKRAVDAAMAVATDVPLRTAEACRAVLAAAATAAATGTPTPSATRARRPRWPGRVCGAPRRTCASTSARPARAPRSPAGSRTCRARRTRACRESCRRRSRAHPAGGRGVGHRLLIVDDEEAIVLTMKEYFETYGHEVDCARGKDEAEAFLRASRYSLMIADLRLHPVREAEGLDLLALVRERYPRTKVVLFTGYATPETVSEARRLGADALLQKPQALSDVARVVFALLAAPA